MNTTLEEATALLAAIAERLPAAATPAVTVVICPPALYLANAVSCFPPASRVFLGAQNCAQAALRQHIASQYGKAIAQASSILYGGSVTPQDATGLFQEPDIDGALIGGASLHAREFIALVRASRQAALRAAAAGAIHYS